MGLFDFFYSRMSAEFWVRLTGNRKIKKVGELLGGFGNNLLTIEIGAAEGWITRCLALSGVISSGVAYDLSKRRMKKGRNRAMSEGLGKRFSFGVGDAKSLPFRDGEFDVSMLLDVLEHIPMKKDVIKSLREAYRVASKGVIISIPQNDCEGIISKIEKYDFEHVRNRIVYKNSWIYDQEQFQKMLKKQSYDFIRKPKSCFYIIKKRRG